MPRRKPWFGALALLPLAALGACSSSASPSAVTSSTAPATTPTSAATSTAVSAPTTAATATATATAARGEFAGPGPYAVGIVELTLGDRPVTVWYPAAPGSDAGAPKASYDLRALLPAADQAKLVGLAAAVYPMDASPSLPAAPGAFPLVLFSHGFAGFRQQSSFLTTAIASWGFVVAAPEHLSRDLTAVVEGRLLAGQRDVDDLRQTVGLLAAENTAAGSVLAGHVDTTKLGAVGHSAGGDAVFQLAADPAMHLGAVVGLAPAIAATPAPPAVATPSLTLLGTADSVITPARLSAAWGALPAGAKRLVQLQGVTHLGFMDTCSQGDVLQEARANAVAVPELVVRLFADGCDAKYTKAQDAWPVIEHTTIAELRAGLGIDPAPVGLDAGLASAFAPLQVSLQAA